MTVVLLFVSQPGHAFASREPTRAENGMVVSAHHLASEIGLDILKKGGNAVDAAIATGFALAVTYPSGGNIGGGGFMLVRMADGEVHSLDFREVAPGVAKRDMYLDEAGAHTRPDNHEGYRSVAVPGTVAGFFLAHEKWASIPMSDLMQPAIDLATEGFALSQALTDDFETHRDDFLRYPASARTFLKDGKELYAPGEIWKQPDLARTLKLIQTMGRDEFYTGETARLLVRAMAENGGLITAEDLEAYEAVEREPIHGTYRGLDIYGMGPPSSGGVAVVQILNILEGYDLREEDFGSARALHLLAEAMRRAFRDRALHLGDPDFNADIPLRRLVSKAYAERLRSGIMPDLASASEPIEGQVLTPRNAVPPESQETTHFSVMDREGNAVAVTFTIEQAYGSKIIAEGTGFLLNNEMGDFNPEPGRTDVEGLIGTPPNLIAPGKRMLSSMSPTIVVREEKPYLVVGTPGGRSIINTVAQIIVHVVDFGMDIGEAVAAPRIHHPWFPDVLRVERYGMSEAVMTTLRDWGHTIEVEDSSRDQGGAMCIRIDPETGMLEGAADPRKYDSLATGY